MIFVALGTQKFQMNRLLESIDKQIQTGLIKDEVFSQIGNSDYTPQNYGYESFLSTKQFNDYITKSEIIITHSGVSTIIKSLLQNKKVIVVPRLAKFGEHVDDHQIEIAETFSSLNYVFLSLEVDDLHKLIFKIKTHEFNQYKSGNEVMLKTIEDYLRSVDTL